MFPQIFESLCAHKISFVQHFTIFSVYETTCMRLCAYNEYWRHIYVRFLNTSFLVCARLTACARASLGAVHKVRHAIFGQF